MFKPAFHFHGVLTDDMTMISTMVPHRCECCLFVFYCQIYGWKPEPLDESPHEGLNLLWAKDKIGVYCQEFMASYWFYLYLVQLF